MNYKKIKTCLNNAIKRINTERKGCACAWTYIKNYCDNNNFGMPERDYIYRAIDRYLEKRNKNIA